MALDARSRTSIYQKLIPILGDDDANKLMTEFPSLEADELVTKQFLRAEMAGLRADLVGMIGGVEIGLRAEMAGLAGELRAEMHALETRMLVRMGAAMVAQTTLLVAAMSLLR